MEQLEFFNVPSPCVRVCTVDERGYCQGCMRNRQERFDWLNMTPTQQLHVIKLCRQRYRRKMMKQRKEEQTLSRLDNQDPQQSLF
ncbi:DUF1289 domain-containing protein [Vibrio penaeicida]|uniref:DUF1289 domain-containing protein n=1 Tax=Vibrio penaeicida TaxID=104609 RepID=UPI000CEA4DA1|nr:DUF1289 domain-containing protein [Vibrio penaeicida]